MIKVDAKVDLFAEYKTDCSFEITFLGTHHDYRQRSIGRELCVQSIKLAAELRRGENISSVVAAELRQCRPDMVTAIFTSRFSQKIGEALGFVGHADIGYDEFEWAGKTYAARLQHRPESVNARLVSYPLKNL